MAYDRTGLIDINIPKTRNESDATYDYTGFARSPNTLEAEPYWAWLRTKKSNGDTDWAQNSAGVATNDYIHLGTNGTGAGLSYGEDA
ncbi:MAG: hypothetical protein K2Q14_04260 [Gammaproteobacteria bacterium]|nr:hypothetical protein [Nitrosomonas sp.]MBY0544744.1 hypothetical protein [Gammaproteobacteria bacterium]